MYDDDTASEISLEVGAEAGPDFEAQARLQSASVAQSGPTTVEGVPSAVPPSQSALRRFSKEHAVSDDIQKRFMIAVEDDEKAAKKRVQEMLVRFQHPVKCRPAMHVDGEVSPSSFPITPHQPSERYCPNDTDTCCQLLRLNLHAPA